VYFIWVAFVAMVGLGLATGSLRGLLTVVLSVDTLLFVVLLAVSLRVTREARVEERATA
jgi:hypothetical protein